MRVLDSLTQTVDVTVISLHLLFLNAAEYGLPFVRSFGYASNSFTTGLTKQTSKYYLIMCVAAGLEKTFAANHLGHFLLANVLVPQLKYVIAI